MLKQSVDYKAVARGILTANDRGGYTVPTEGLYPFQWNWDSAFCAIGFATFDRRRALEELESLYAGQWDTGLVPHIVFHRDAETYFPGPEIWGCGRSPPTSGITQPPVTATALRFIVEMASGDAEIEARAAALFPKILASHDWWNRERDPDGTGLVAILHPWESGADNSPAWDGPLARTPRTTTRYQRRDTDLVDPLMRPVAADYDRFLYLVELYRGENWEGPKLWRRTPFKVADAGVNAILMRDERDLLALAKRFGRSDAEPQIEARVSARSEALERLWSPARKAYLSLDVMTGTLVAQATHSSFLPLWGQILPEERVEDLFQTLAAWRSAGARGVPTLSPAAPEFDARRYWRGPTWGMVNYMIAKGFLQNGRPVFAETLRQETEGLITSAGFYEYFDPLTGQGLGGGDFSWTAAIGLAWALN